MEIASEQKMRNEAKVYTCQDNLKAEYMPFTFLIKDKHHSVELRNVPMAYLVDLWAKITDMLKWSDDHTKG